MPEAYLLGDRALYLASYNNVKDAVSPDGIIPDAGAKTTLKAMASFNPKVKPDQIDRILERLEKVRAKVHK